MIKEGKSMFKSARLSVVASVLLALPFAGVVYADDHAPAATEAAKPADAAKPAEAAKPADAASTPDVSKMTKEDLVKFFVDKCNEGFDEAMKKNPETKDMSKLNAEQKAILDKYRNVCACMGKSEGFADELMSAAQANDSKKIDEVSQKYMDKCMPKDDKPAADAAKSSESKEDAKADEHKADEKPAESH
jgi:hypothetical protein